MPAATLIVLVSVDIDPLDVDADEAARAAAAAAAVSEVRPLSALLNRLNARVAALTPDANPTPDNG
jgi:hypothetical protein